MGGAGRLRDEPLAMVGIVQKQRLAKRCALRAHGMGCVGLSLRAEAGWGSGGRGALAGKMCGENGGWGVAGQPKCVRCARTGWGEGGGGGAC